ncbi:hypothetical protein MSG28_005687 [Choristoneura fumiferana]|uniref:Uncharacterized protein n=1 Tax=Choristoneura fumiferana TaxID=7141 RepID=A0ACC0L0K9_CHOFU|nr:hypothetical protein MSG28_005687 [Choristoneura fumiferana]
MQQARARGVATAQQPASTIARTSAGNVGTPVQSPAAAGTLGGLGGLGAGPAAPPPAAASPARRAGPAVVPAPTAQPLQTPSQQQPPTTQPNLMQNSGWAANNGGALGLATPWCPAPSPPARETPRSPGTRDPCDPGGAPPRLRPTATA